MLISITLPETNIFAPEKGWLEDDPFLLEWLIFRGYVSFWEGSWWFPPIWTICSSKWIISPRIGGNIKNVWNHHLDMMLICQGVSYLWIYIPHPGCQWPPGWDTATGWGVDPNHLVSSRYHSTLPRHIVTVSHYHLVTSLTHVTCHIINYSALIYCQNNLINRTCHQ